MKDFIKKCILLLDSNYFWHIKSISKKDFNIANELMGSIFLGINTDYNKNIDLKNFKSLNFVVDLESKNKKKIINYINQGKESEETSITESSVALIFIPDKEGRGVVEEIARDDTVNASRNSFLEILKFMVASFYLY